MPSHSRQHAYPERYSRKIVGLAASSVPYFLFVAATPSAFRSSHRQRVPRLACTSAIVAVAASWMESNPTKAPHRTRGIRRTLIVSSTITPSVPSLPTNNCAEYKGQRGTESARARQIRESYANEIIYLSECVSGCAFANAASSPNKLSFRSHDTKSNHILRCCTIH